MRPCSPRPGASHRQRSGIDCVLPKDARRAAPEGRAASRRPSALARVTARAVVPVAAVGGLAGLSLAAPAVTAAAPATAHMTAARPVPAIGHPVLTKGL